MRSKTLAASILIGLCTLALSSASYSSDPQGGGGDGDGGSGGSSGSVGATPGVSSNWTDGAVTSIAGSASSTAPSNSVTFSINSDDSDDPKYSSQVGILASGSLSKH